MGSVSEKGKLNPRVKSRRAGFWREGGIWDVAAKATMALLSHPLIAPSSLMDPCENCIDLSPVTENTSLSILPFLFFLRTEPTPPPFFILAPCWFSLGQELIPSLWLVASGGCHVPKSWKRSISVAYRAREEKITSSSSSRYKDSFRFISSNSLNIFMFTFRTIFPTFWKGIPFDSLSSRPFPLFSLFSFLSFLLLFSEFNRPNPRARRALNLCQRLGLFSQIKDSGGEIDTRSTTPRKILAGYVRPADK